MSSKPYKETVCEGHKPLRPNYGATTVGLHADPLEYPVQQVTDEMFDEVQYLDDLETRVHGVERDFHKAILSQFGEQRTMGRAAVLRMSHPYPSNGNEQHYLTQRRIQWQKLRDPAEHAQSSKTAANDSGSAESPEGLLFQDLGAFREALNILPRHDDKSTVPQFFDKQLIVLEDLGRDWVETIGKAFHVPPRVFALHWASPSFYQRSRARVPLGQPAEEHFVLPYSEILPCKIKEGFLFLFSITQVSAFSVCVSYLTWIIVGEHFFKLDCCSIRFVSSDMQSDEDVVRQWKQESDATNTLCEAMISYWGRLGEHEEWTGRYPPRLHVARRLGIAH